MKKTKKERKRMLLITSVICFLSFMLIHSVASDWGEILDNNKEIKKLNYEYSSLLEEEEKLSSDVTKLQDEDYVARYAKEKFLYSQNGDIILKID